MTFLQLMPNVTEKGFPKDSYVYGGVLKNTRTNPFLFYSLFYYLFLYTIFLILSFVLYLHIHFIQYHFRLT
jgi:hypothetical protein